MCVCVCASPVFWEKGSCVLSLSLSLSKFLACLASGEIIITSRVKGHCWQLHHHFIALHWCATVTQLLRALHPLDPCEMLIVFASAFSFSLSLSLSLSPFLSSAHHSVLCIIPCCSQLYAALSHTLNYPLSLSLSLSFSSLLSFELQWMSSLAFSWGVKLIALDSTSCRRREE